ncbi:MAG: family 1 glycosylhydrolase [Saprospiraceae bacterium]
MNKTLLFPKDFTWGAATSAYQIEGAHLLDGKGALPSGMPFAVSGKIANRATGDLACDHYHRIEEDVALMKKWDCTPTPFFYLLAKKDTTSSGEVFSSKGLHFYAKLIDTLLFNGIQPWVTALSLGFALSLQFEEDGWLGHSIAMLLPNTLMCALNILATASKHGSPSTKLGSSQCWVMGGACLHRGAFPMPNFPTSLGTTF